MIVKASFPAVEEWVWADTGKTVGWLLAGGGRGQLAFHTICEDPRQPGAGAGHLMQHCSTAAEVCYIHIVTVSSYAVARRPMNSKWSAAQQTGNCELELAGEARTVFAELGGGDCG